MDGLEILETDGPEERDAGRKGRATAEAFPALAEASRRSGDAIGAEHVARQGLRLAPDDLAGRVALALALLDQDRADDARRELEALLDLASRAAGPAFFDVPESVQTAPAHGFAPVPPPVPAQPLGDLEVLDELDFDRAFDAAEPEPDDMIDADRVALEAMREAALDAPEDLLPGPGSPFATRTMAALLERQGHPDEADALRAAIEADEEAARPPVAAASAGGVERARVIRTLERWLANLQGGRA